jgi:ankyrin repeat protein
MPWLGAPTTFGSSRESKTLDVSSTECQSVLMNLLKGGSRNQVGELVPTFTVELQKFLPERHMGELSTQVKKLFDPSHKQPIQQLFEIVAYFSSNNMLSSSQTETFVRWVVDQKYVDPLKLFLQIDMPTVHAFGSRLLEAGIRAQQPSFLKQMHAAGAKFDECAQQAMEINDREFLLFVLAQLDSELLKGESGGQLLHKHVSRKPYISVIQKLIQAGAEVNIRLSNDFKTTPLWEAINKKSLDIVKCLVDGGADVNKLSFIEPNSSLGHALYQNHQPIVEYLLDKEADTEVDVFSGPLLEYAASHRPEIYLILLKRLPDVPCITPGQIVSSANSDPKVLSKFLSQHPELSEQKLEEALVESLKMHKTKAVVNLLRHGVDPNGSHLGKASKRPLEVAITDRETWTVTYQYMDLLIHAKADVNIDSLIFTLLETRHFNERVFNKLIEAGFDLDRYGAEALEYAAVVNTEVIPFLLDKGVSIDSYGIRFTVLQAAAQYSGDVQLLRLLIDRGADINAPPFAVRGRTALQAAALSGNMEMLRLLYDHGADINGPIALTDGITALEATLRPWESTFEYDDDWCEYSDYVPTEAFLFLLDHGASVNRPDGSPSPLLHDLIELKGTDLLRRALEAKANANHYWRTVSSSWFDRTPLQLAAEKGQLESIRLLLDSGASPNESPAHKHGRTALQAAASCETPSMELIQLLLSHGAVINAPPAASGGITALQGAAIRGHINIAQMLIENGAEVNALPALKDGCTAIEGAAEHGRLDMAKMLINAGATGDVVGKTRFTKAISLAKKNRHFQVAKLLEAQ